ncbi:hypothetical protein CPB84DRAFT_1789856 [Gymnopilus junonius]|uniref:Uncharacterized protein n=1 Tax=Gymnopilus junonius TaxID=109634 RepID=A0A9P5NDC9_GYMJU|nr:hypothetical protein CPB84DRAFT_1789856 [Gymnopilus junonius]
MTAFPKLTHRIWVITASSFCSKNLLRSFVMDPVERPSSDLQAVTLNEAANAARIRHHRILLRWWIGCCFAFMAAIPILAVMLGLHLHARDFRYTQDTTPGFNGRTLLMEVVLRSADPQASVMTMDWTVIGEENSQCSPEDLSACTDINIFFDANLLHASSTAETIRSSNRPADPIFIHNASALAEGDILANTPTFRTDLALFSPGGTESSLIYYPFDEYSAEICIFAQDSKDNTVQNQCCTSPGVSIPPGVVDIIITLTRANLVRAFSIVTVIAIVRPFASSASLTSHSNCLGLIIHSSSRHDHLCILGFLATLFAFTQLRGSMPGAPEGFDFVGLLPCLALLSLSAALTLGAFILSDPTEKAQVLSWELIFEAFPRLDPKGTHRKHLRNGEKSVSSGQEYSGA